MKEKLLRNFAAIAWYLAIALIALWVGKVTQFATGTLVVGIPVALLFVLLVVLAGPPHLVRPPGSRYVHRVRVIPVGERNWFTKVFPFRIVRLVRLKPRFTVFRVSMIALASTVVFGMAAYPYVDARMKEGAINTDAMVKYDPIVTTQVFDDTGEEEVCLFHSDVNRILVPLDKIPLHVRQAFIAAEDRDFYEHGGVNPIAIARALRTNYLTGSQQGGSGITQQVVKGILIKIPKPTLSRKVQEAWLAVEVERLMTKDEILYDYLNEISLGHGTNGVEAASRVHFGKHVWELSVAEGAILAGLPKAPTRYSPHVNFARAKVRQGYVLGQMVKAGFLTQEQADAAAAEEISVVSRAEALNEGIAGHYCRRIYNSLKAEYGVDAIYRKGLIVHTGLNMKMQKAADSAVRRGLIDLERRIGFGGPEGHDDAYAGCGGSAQQVSDGFIDLAVLAKDGDQPAVCLRGAEYSLHSEDVARIRSWERSTGSRLKVGDQLSVQIITELSEKDDGPKRRFAISARRTDGPDHPEQLQSAMLVTDPHTGEVKAYVGGYDYRRSQWDSVYQASLQPGSSIKPYVYLTALMNGMQPDEILVDAQRCYDSPTGPWCPENFRSARGGRQYYGAVNLRTAMAQSLNSISVLLAARYGIEECIDTMRALGIRSPLPRVLPLAVGATELTLWEHTMAYTSIAANGKKLPKHPWTEDAGILIRSIRNARGELLYESDKAPRSAWPQAVPAAAAAELIYLMRGVVQSGTGKRLQELQRPAAGKTGTTNDFKDTWFMSFTNDVVVGVWVGRMTPAPITKEATGGSVALPIALAAMKQLHPDTPARAFETPDDVVLVPDASGDLIPYERGHLPDDYLGALPTFSGMVAGSTEVQVGGL